MVPYGNTFLTLDNFFSFLGSNSERTCAKNNYQTEQQNSQNIDLDAGEVDLGGPLFSATTMTKPNIDLKIIMR